MLATSNVLISEAKILNSPLTIKAVTKLKKNNYKYLKGALSIRVVDTGSTNACEQELNALSNPVYDISRFGISFVASPKHADMLIVTGPVTRNMAEALKKAYEATPEPKIVVALGDDAINGGLFKGSYAVLDGVDKIIPVNYQILGDPPTPLAILRGLLEIISVLNRKT